MQPFFNVQMDFYMQSVCQNHLQKELRQESGEVLPSMFMNISPRRIVYGHETFVYGGRTEPVHQRLSEMTENQINAWKSTRPVMSSSRPNDNRWYDQKGAFDQDKNYQAVHLENSCMQSPQDYDQVQNFYQGTTPSSYNSIPSLRQNTFFSGQPGSTSLYQRDNMQADCAIKPEAVREKTSNQWPWTTPSTNLSYNAEDQDLLRMFPYHTISECVSQPCYGFPSTSSLRSMIEFDLDNSLDINSHPPSLYVDYSTPGTVPNEPLSQMPFRAASQNENAHPRMVWNGTLGNTQWHDEMNSLGSELSNSHCDFQTNDPWVLGPLPATDWLKDTHELSTISPEVLTLDSSSTIVPGECPETLDSGRDRSRVDTTLILLKDSVSLLQPTKNYRKSLPREETPPFPNARATSSINIKRVSEKRDKTSRTDSPIPKNAKGEVSNRLAFAKKIPPTHQAGIAPKKIHPKRVAAIALPARKSPNTVTTLPPLNVAKPVNIKPAPIKSPELSPKVDALKRQESKDHFLVRSKLAGMSYKDIRKAGGFSEAESTLRGRFRTLTKEKEARVRRPEWNDNDIKLLRRAVQKLNHGLSPKDQGQMKVPWKHVAEHIASNGGSYHFGYATCRKKWDELQVSGGS